MNRRAHTRGPAGLFSGQIYFYTILRPFFNPCVHYYPPYMQSGAIFAVAVITVHILFSSFQQSGRSFDATCGLILQSSNGGLSPGRLIRATAPSLPKRIFRGTALLHFRSDTVNSFNPSRRNSSHPSITQA